MRNRGLRQSSTKRSIHNTECLWVARSTVAAAQWETAAAVGELKEANGLNQRTMFIFKRFFSLSKSRVHLLVPISVASADIFWEISVSSSTTALFGMKGVSHWRRRDGKSQVKKRPWPCERYERLFTAPEWGYRQKGESPSTDQCFLLSIFSWLFSLFIEKPVENLLRPTTEVNTL